MRKLIIVNGGFVGINNSKKEERQMKKETPLESPEFFYDAPKDALQNVQDYFIKKYGKQVASSRLKTMTAQKVIELDEKLREPAMNVNCPKAPLLSPEDREVM